MLDDIDDYEPAQSDECCRGWSSVSMDIRDGFSLSPLAWVVLAYLVSRKGVFLRHVIIFIAPSWWSWQRENPLVMLLATRRYLLAPPPLFDTAGRREAVLANQCDTLMVLK